MPKMMYGISKAERVNVKRSVASELQLLEVENQQDQAEFEEWCRGEEDELLFFSSLRRPRAHRG
mgnify:FL=1